MTGAVGASVSGAGAAPHETFTVATPPATATVVIDTVPSLKVCPGWSGASRYDDVPGVASISLDCRRVVGPLPILIVTPFTAGSFRAKLSNTPPGERRSR